MRSLQSWGEPPLRCTVATPAAPLKGPPPLVGATTRFHVEQRTEQAPGPRVADVVRSEFRFGTHAAEALDTLR
jgi:hypothetical protein